MAKYSRFDPRNKRRGANQQKHAVDSLQRSIKTPSENTRRSAKVNTRDYEAMLQDEMEEELGYILPDSLKPHEGNE